MKCIYSINKKDNTSTIKIDRDNILYSESNIIEQYPDINFDSINLDVDESIVDKINNDVEPIKIKVLKIVLVNGVELKFNTDEWEIECGLQGII